MICSELIGIVPEVPIISLKDAVYEPETGRLEVNMQTIVELFDSLYVMIFQYVDDEFVYFIDFQHIMDAARGHTFSNYTQITGFCWKTDWYL